METTGIMSAVYQATLWIMRLALLNLYWILFSVAGLFLFGVFPATAAMLAIIRKWLYRETDIPIFKTFAGYFRKEIIKSNIVGYMTLAIGAVLYIDYRFFMMSENAVLQGLGMILFVAFLFFILTSLYIFPIFVHLDVKGFHVIKKAFMMMIINPIPTLMMIFGLLGYYFIMSRLQGLLPLYGASLFGFINMISCYFAFRKVQEKQTHYQERHTA
ncbi:YesL family protein [Alkalihalobacillus trypoxylicola]|uniref:DUF624 domain-containing protein n=1 Tax=Alkalihalobacillus trypoxylicola TaxID=519424 RepID=A0A161P9A9_9BACI|nr:YesL family protein [Alkalihalobacillus trypoxylicola]KYG27620.1 hypothetical protein AZF04_10525 [Alkalihalobacillus trypoxylicola]